MSAGRVSPFTLPQTPVADRPDRRKKRRSRRVSRILSAVAGRALRRYRFRRDDHSSRPGIARGLQRPTRRLRTGRPLDPPTCVDEPVPPYLVLLRAGFCLPPTLPPARCALTAPFHPYLSCPRRYFFCATDPSDCSARALPGALPSGVRTFLPPSPLATPLRWPPVRKPAIVWSAATPRLSPALEGPCGEIHHRGGAEAPPYESKECFPT